MVMQADASPLVTVITPVYNAERHIERCISSVLDQTYGHWEQIVVDDGSTDGTAERIAAFRDPRIRFVSMPHRGLAALAETYNVGLREGTGSLVAILEGDDFWPRDKLLHQVPSFDDPDVLLSYGRAVVVDENDEPQWQWPRPALADRDLTMPELFRRLVRANTLTPAVTVMVRRSALDHIDGFQQAGAEFVDLPTWLTMATRLPGRALLLDEHLGYYRVHSAQTSAQRDHQMRFNHYHVVETVTNRLDAASAQRLGWDDATRRAALASADVTRGIAHLRGGQRANARAHFLRGLKKSDSVRERVRAGLGVLSTIAPFDFVAIADRARIAASALSLRLKSARIE